MKRSTSHFLRQLRPDVHTVLDLQLNNPDTKQYLIHSKAFSLFFKTGDVGVKTPSFDPQMFACTFGRSGTREHLAPHCCVFEQVAMATASAV